MSLEQKTGTAKHSRWENSVKIVGVILAAGEGTRLRPLTLTVPKPVVKIMGKPLMVYGMELLKKIGVRKFVVVVGALGEVVKAYLGDGRKYGVELSYVLQAKRLGIAHAVHLAITQGGIRSPFFVHLSDNLIFDESWIDEFKELAETKDAIFFLTEVEDPRRFGVAVIRDGKVVGFVEKPKEPPSKLALVGMYYFRDPEEYEKCYSTLTPSWRGEYEITDIINCYLKSRKDVEFLRIRGWWKDAGKPEDLIDAMIHILDHTLQKPIIKGKVEGGEVVGRVYVEEGARIEGIVYGPAYVGKGVVVGKESVVEHYVDLEEGSSLLSGSVSRSLILEESILDLKHSRLIDSIVGSRSKVVISSTAKSILTLHLSSFSSVLVR